MAVEPPGPVDADRKEPPTRFFRLGLSAASPAPPKPAVRCCSQPPRILASQAFQEDPLPVEILGVRETEHGLFELLERTADPEARREAFHEYMALRFEVDQRELAPKPAPTAPRRHYLHFLRGWRIDSNSRSGAVLKSWVENRFGLSATYHGGILAEDPAASLKFLNDKRYAESRGTALQLDLAYTFCQFELARRFPGERWLTLYRGTHDPDEYAVHREGYKGGSLVALNNLSSFTSDREVAWEFGSSVWEVKVPLPKIVFYGALLPASWLESEQEFLVLGGEYRVTTLIC